MSKYDSPDLYALPGLVTTGAVPSPPDDRDFKFLPRALAPQALPPAAAITNVGRPARWQDQKGSCTIFAFTGVLENEWAKLNRFFDGSEDYAFARAHERYGDLCSNGGIVCRDAASIFCDEGIITEAERPYGPDLCTGTTAAERQSAAAWRGGGYYTCETLDGIKAALSANHAVVCCMKVFGAIFLTQQLTGHLGLLPDRWSEWEVGDHAMYIEDYDDERFGGTFGVVNSWGDGLGDRGRIYVPYHYLDLSYEEGGIWTFDTWTFVGVAVPPAPAPEPARRGRHVVALAQAWIADPTQPGGWRVEEVARGERAFSEAGWMTSEFQIEGRETVYHDFAAVEAGDA